MYVVFRRINLLALLFNTIKIIIDPTIFYLSSLQLISLLLSMYRLSLLNLLE